MLLLGATVSHNRPVTHSEVPHQRGAPSMKLRNIFVLVLLLLSPLHALGVELNFNEGPQQESGVFKGDYLFAGETIDFRGEVDDLFAFAEKVEFYGRAKSEVTALAGTIILGGAIDNGIKAIGESITLSGTSGGTHFLAGSAVTIDGPVNGDLFIAGGEVMVNNTIEGDLYVAAEVVEIGGGGLVNGDLVYYSGHELGAEESSRVSGQIHFTQSEWTGGHPSVFGEEESGESLVSLLLFKLAFALFGFFVLLIPATKGLEHALQSRGVGTHLMWGVLTLLLYPVVTLISLILIVTIPLGITLLLGLIPLLMIANVAGLTLLGQHISDRFNLGRGRFLSYSLAVLPYSLLTSLPFAGLLLFLLVTAVGLGLLLSRLFSMGTSKGSIH